MSNDDKKLDTSQSSFIGVQMRKIHISLRKGGNGVLEEIWRDTGDSDCEPGKQWKKLTEVKEEKKHDN